MQDLLHTLQDTDRGRLQIIAELWGLQPESGPMTDMAQQLASSMLEPALANEVYQSLPDHYRNAIQELLHRSGKMPASEFDRLYGPLRNMGAGKRDREKPWRDPVSSAEALWYYAFIARAFADDDLGPREYIFVPDDLRSILPLESDAGAGLPRPLTHPPDVIRPARATIVDDATTILAAVRAGTDARLEEFLLEPEARRMIEALLIDLGTVNRDNRTLQSQETRRFLEQPRESALGMLALAWRNSATFNDLAQLPHLLPSDDGWPNDPLATRMAYLSLLQQLPINEWFGLAGFIAWFKSRQPSFQRPAGEFDAWYLRSANTGEFMRGFEFWQAIEGSLIEIMTLKHLFWLGSVDLGFDEEAGAPSAFQLTARVSTLFEQEAPISAGHEVLENVHIGGDGRISVPRKSNRANRYQISRFSTWLEVNKEIYQYRITLDSLEASLEAGLEANHILKFLKGLEDAEIPPSLSKAILRWETEGVEARIVRWVVLHVRDPETIDGLMKNPSTARYLGERLDPERVLVEEKSVQKLQMESTRLGLFIGNPDQSERTISAKKRRRSA